MKITFVGTGDAFGSEGRLQTCFHVEAGGATFLVDCGVTSLIGMARLGLDPNGVGTIFVSHLHGDHFGGLVWFVLHARHVSNRTTALTVVGPPGIEARYNDTFDALYPGSRGGAQNFSLRFEEFDEANDVDVSGVRAGVAVVSHPSGAPSYALRLRAGGQVLAFSGDTEWVDGLVDISRGADLFICECYGYATKVPYHIDWLTLSRMLPRLDAVRVVLTHMGPDMLVASREQTFTGVQFAHDGLCIDI